jgi:hypothetical protein
MGVMVKEDYFDGHVNFIHVFPSEKESYYKSNTIVSVEWDQKIWGRSWYRDLSSNAIVVAFDSSATFSGRDIDEYLQKIQ